MYWYLLVSLIQCTEIEDELKIRLNSEKKEDAYTTIN